MTADSSGKDRLTEAEKIMPDEARLPDSPRME